MDNFCDFCLQRMVGCGTGQLQHLEQCKSKHYINAADRFVRAKVHPKDDPKQEALRQEMEDLHEQLTKNEKVHVPTPSFYYAELSKKLGGHVNGIVMCACGESIFFIAEEGRCLFCNRDHRVPDRYRQPERSTVVCKCGHVFSRKDQKGVCEKCGYENWIPDKKASGWMKDKRSVKCQQCGHGTLTNKLPEQLIACDNCDCLIDVPKRLEHIKGLKFIDAWQKIAKDDPIAQGHAKAQALYKERQAAREELAKLQESGELTEDKFKEIIAVLNKRLPKARV